MCDLLLSDQQLTNKNIETIKDLGGNYRVVIARKE